MQTKMSPTSEASLACDPLTLLISFLFITCSKIAVQYNTCFKEYFYLHQNSAIRLFYPLKKTKSS